jgi:voltage-gated potassium channel
LTCALIVALYYVVPVDPSASGLQLALRTAGTVVSGLLITWLIVRQVRQHIAETEPASLVGLVTALVGGAMFFALTDYVTAVSAPGQFAGLQTRTDALYFALTTLTTVGYGDVHAAGQIARTVVIIQLVFNLVVIATGASVFTRLLRERARHRATGADAAESQRRDDAR